MKEYIRHIIDGGDFYKGNGMMLGLYFMCLLMIAFSVKEKKIKKVIVLPACISLVLLYIAVPFVDAFKRDMDDFSGRFFWLLLTPVVTAVALTIFVWNVSGWFKRTVCVLCIFAMVFFCGDFQISNAMFKKAENDYRLPEAAVQITEYILSENENPLIVVPYTIAHPFRQISTKVNLLFGEDATIGRIIFPKDKEFNRMCVEMEREIPNLDFIVEKCNQYDVDYIVFDTVYTSFCEDGNININGYPKDPDYVGDRTPKISYEDLKNVSLIGSEEDPYWDLSEYGLSYDGRFGQYVLYKFD